MGQVALDQTICTYYEERDRDPHARYRSWEHCYGFFREHHRELLQVKNNQVKNNAALHLGFYLASWGMYRGSSFLLQHTHTAHMRVIDALALPQFRNLWQHDVGSDSDDVKLAPTIMELVGKVKCAYEQFGRSTDTLTSKVLLGTIGCLPACDRFFIKGFRVQGFKYSSLNKLFIDRILQYCIDSRQELARLQSKIIDRGGPRYPLMKLVDMHFWQIGFDLQKPKKTKGSDSVERIRSS